MNRKVLWTLLVCLGVAAILEFGGCASTSPSQVDAPVAGQCAVAAVGWPAWRENYDEKLSTDRLVKLEEIARADRALLKAGHQVGAQLDALLREPAGSGFVSHETLELAVRLRQLTCAVQQNRLEAGTADKLYGSALGDIEKERGQLLARTGRRAEIRIYSVYPSGGMIFDRSPRGTRRSMPR